MRTTIATLLLALPALAQNGPTLQDQAPHDHAPGFPQHLALSPDAQTLVFAAAGDLWAVSTEGGPATRLTSHPASETRAAFSPDGATLAFESDRHGSRNLYVMDLTGTPPALVASAPRRVTTSDRSQTLGGFDADGQALIYSARHDATVYKEDRMYRAPLDGGPVERITRAHGSLPRVSPDGMAIYFHRGNNPEYRPAYRGPGNHDAWRYLPGADRFERLTTHDANDYDPHPLPGGTAVLVSSRDGQNNLWRLDPSAQGEARLTQLTAFAPTPNQHTLAHGVRDLAVAADGSLAAFAVWNDIYTLDLTNPGAEPRKLTVSTSADTDALDIDRLNLDREADEVALHPSGKAIAIVARGEILVRDVAEDRPARRVTDTVWRERDIAWSPDGTTLYFSRDSERSLGDIHAATVALSRDDLEPKPEAPVEDDAADEPTDEDADDIDSGGDEPDATDQPDDPTDDDEAEDEKDEDEKDEDKPDPGKRWADALRFAITPVHAADTWDRNPLPSPDNRTLLITRARGDLVLHDLATGEQRTVLESWDVPEALWAPDSRHIIYSVVDLDFNSDIHLLDTKPDEQGNLPDPINLTQHPDYDSAPRLSADAKVLAFLSDRDGNNWERDVYAIYLDESLEGLRPYELADHFEQAAKAAKKRKPIDPVTLDTPDDDAPPADNEPADDQDDADADAAESEDDAPEPLTFDTEDAYLRVRRITNFPGSEADLALTPGGDRFVFSAVVDGDRTLYSVDHRANDRKSLQSGGVGDISTSLTGDKVVYIRAGRAHTVPPTGGKTTDYPVDVPVVIDVAAQQHQKFLEAARTFGMTFYNMKGLDWQAISDRYHDLAVATRTPDAFNRVLSMLWGEVDGSHTGTWGGGGYNAPSPRNGYLGIDAEPAADGYRVTAVIPDTPADRDASRLEIGDVILEIDGRPLARQDTRAGLADLHAALAGTAGNETLLTIRRRPDADDDNGGGAEDGADTRYVLITPTGYGAERNARYDHEVELRRAEVDRLSDGRLGYLHIRSMGAASVRDFERDLYAAANGKEGLVIDVRDNGGGWTTDILLTSLTAPRHAYTVPRGADPDDVKPDHYPRDRRLIYAWSRPITVLMNQHSFSNAEIFSHAIKTTGRGRLVGTQTFGGVISTGSFRLIDGTTIRRPFRGWYLPDGTDMEHHGAVPDVAIPQTPADEAAGRDPQLEAGVADLLAQIDGR